MFFLHALLLFFLLDTTLFSMAAVLPRNAGGYGYLHTRGVPSGAAYQPVGPKGNGFGNLHIRDTSPGLAELDGYWELDVSYFGNSTLPCLTLLRTSHNRVMAAVLLSFTSTGESLMASFTV